jgi:hypothetical protein
MVQINNIELAKGYSQFMVALGGVSITVLTLVLTLRKEIADQRLFFFLNAALIVATIVCFIGAHGMAEVSAIPEAHMLGARRLYMVASVNIYMAAALFLFSLMLLPRVYDEDMPAALKAIAFWSFVGVEIGALAWMVSFILQLGHADSPLGLIGAGVSAAVVGIYEPRPDPATGFVAFPFWVSIAISGMSLVLLAATFQLLTGPQWFDVMFYCVGMATPSVALIRLGWKEYRKY